MSGNALVRAGQSSPGRERDGRGGSAPRARTDRTDLLARGVRAGAGALFVIHSGCDPGWEVFGSVRYVSGASPSAVQIECAFGGAFQKVPLSTAGTFYATGIGCVDSDCRLNVFSSAGKTSWKPLIGTCKHVVFACRGGRGGTPPGCSSLHVDMVLPDP